MSGKVLFSSWLMLIVVVTSVYCANLVASMSIQDESSLFSSLEDVVASDYSVGMRISGLSHTILKVLYHPQRMANLTKVPQFVQHAP